MRIRVRDGITPDLARLMRAVRNMRPAMERVRRGVLDPMIPEFWSASGLRSRSGELRRAVTTRALSKSAKILVNVKGKVLPKAVTHLRGAQARQYRKKETYKVRSKKGNEFDRTNPGSPWGAIPSRRFFPRVKDVRARQSRIVEIITRFLRGED